MISSRVVPCEVILVLAVATSSVFAADILSKPNIETSGASAAVLLIISSVLSICKFTFVLTVVVAGCFSFPLPSPFSLPVSSRRFFAFFGLVGGGRLDGAESGRVRFARHHL